MLEKHTRQKHRKPDSCQYCDYDAKDRGILQDHMIEVHEEYVILHTMAQQVDHISDSFVLFETFKTELTGVLKSLFDSHNAVKQELFVIRNKQAEFVSLLDKPKHSNTLHMLNKPIINSNQPQYHRLLQQSQHHQ